MTEIVFNITWKEVKWVSRSVWAALANHHKPGGLWKAEMCCLRFWSLAVWGEGASMGPWGLSSWLRISLVPSRSRKSWGAPRRLSEQALIPFIRAPLSWFTHLPKAPSPNSIAFEGLGFRHMDWVGHKYSDHRIGCEVQIKGEKGHGSRLSRGDSLHYSDLCLYVWNFQN